MSGWELVRLCLKGKGKETALCEFKQQYEDNHLCEKAFMVFFLNVPV